MLTSHLCVSLVIWTSATMKNNFFSLISLLQLLNIFFLIFLWYHWSVFSLRNLHRFKMSIWLNHALMIYLNLNKSILLKVSSWKFLYFDCFSVSALHSFRTKPRCTACKWVLQPSRTIFFLSLISINLNIVLKTCFFKKVCRISSPAMNCSVISLHSLKNMIFLNFLLSCTAKMNFRRLERFAVD